MKLEGRVWKDGKFWLVEIPAINVMTQGKSKKDALFMIKDAIEMLIDDKGFKCEVEPHADNTFFLASDSLGTLIPFILRRLREKNNLSIRDVAESFGHKSHTAYARYEAGKVKPSLDKFAEYVKAIEDNDLILKVG